MKQANEENQWVNWTAVESPEVFAIARQLLQTCRYLTLATSGKYGTPWSSPLFFVVDQHWDLFWISAIAAQHSLNLEQNQGKGFISLFETDPIQGLFLQGTAHIIKPEEISTVLSLMAAKKGEPLSYTPEDFHEDSPRQFYRFQTEIAWITGDRLPFEGHIIDTKIAMNWSKFQAFKHN